MSQGAIILNRNLNLQQLFIQIYMFNYLLKGENQIIGVIRNPQG
jgi:hypothetical protein